MKLSFLSFFILVTGAQNMVAQDLFLISGGGTHSSGSGGSVSWSIGEVVIATATSSNNYVTQGFHQGNIYIVGVEELVAISISVYPNPTTESVTVQISEPVNVSIYDMSGRLVGSHSLADAINSIDVTSFSRGTYNMIFERKGSVTKNVKLIVL